MRFPAANMVEAAMKLFRRPKISLSFPLKGCVAVRAIKYEDPSHEMIVRDSNSVAIAEDMVEVTVLSSFVNS